MSTPFSAKQITLGELLDRIPDHDEIISVVYDFGLLIPTKPDSYRGYYDHLALGWVDQDADDVSASLFRSWIERALEIEYMGYKGGVYRMDRDTPIWVARWGQTSHTVVTGVRRVAEFQLVITTTHEDET